MMTVWTNYRLSGYRKWCEAQEAKQVAEPGGNDKPTEEPDEELIAVDPMPHRPWLVPGAGRL
jgi:hypothetical protein